MSAAHQDLPMPIGRTLKTKTLSQILESFRPPDWLVPNLIERGQHVLLYGDSEAGKSAILIDIMLRLAMGLPIHGMEATERVGVVYICNEGREGAYRRIPAWVQFHDRDTFETAKQCYPFTVLDQPVLLSDDNMYDVHATIESIQKGTGVPVRVVVVDTMATALDGDENSAQDVNAHCRCIQEMCARGITVIEVHHVGKGARDTPRGSQAIRNSVDGELFAERAEGQQTTYLTNKKLKDAKGVGTMAWRLMGHELTGEFGDVMADVVVATESRVASEVSPQQAQSLEVLIEMYDEACARVREAGREPSSMSPSIVAKDWREELVDREIVRSIKPDTQRKATNAIAHALMKHRLIREVATSEYIPLGSSQKDAPEP